MKKERKEVLNELIENSLDYAIQVVLETEKYDREKLIWILDEMTHSLLTIQEALETKDKERFEIIKKYAFKNKEDK